MMWGEDFASAGVFSAKGDHQVSDMGAQVLGEFIDPGIDLCLIALWPWAQVPVLEDGVKWDLRELGIFGGHERDDDMVFGRALGELRKAAHRGIFNIEAKFVGDPR